MYDAIVVGARCAGSSTAMLLARRVFNVLLVDRATFPSDTISTHILWPHGTEILARWGLRDRLAATGVPPISRRITFDVGPFALCGTIPDANDGLGGFCPRRAVLDSLLVNAAAESGVEVRQSFTVDELLLTGDTVVGIRGHGSVRSATFEELLAGHERTRNERVRPMYEFTTQLAALEPPPPEMQILFVALRGNQDATNAFLSAITGAIPLTEFLSPENVGRIVAAANGVQSRPITERFERNSPCM